MFRTHGRRRHRIVFIICFIVCLHITIYSWCLARIYYNINRKAAYNTLFNEESHSEGIVNISHHWENWNNTRHNLLHKRDVPKKVLLFCYMRGGSTLGGEIFNRDPSAILWYEPVAAYYTAYYGTKYFTRPEFVLYNNDSTHISYSREELGQLADLYRNSFSCNYERLPAEAWLIRSLTHSQALKPIRKCNRNTTDRLELISFPSPMGSCGYVQTSKERNCSELLAEANMFLSKKESDANVSWKVVSEHLAESNGVDMKPYRSLVNHTLNVRMLRNQNQKCLELGISICRKASVHVMETLRIRMAFVESILLENPDMHVIYYIRDPRGIISSRVPRAKAPSEEFYDNRVRHEAKILCDQIRHDLLHKDVLEDKYPGVIMTMRYEDVVRAPVQSAKSAYKHIGLELPKDSQWPTYSREVFFSNNTVDGRFGTRRHNATEVLTKWKKDLNSTHLEFIDKVCGDVIATLGYK